MSNEYKKVLEDLLDIVEKEGASDLHIAENRKPHIRVSGYLIPLVKKEAMSTQELNGIFSALVTAENKDLFLKNKELDFSYLHKSGVRFRGNAYYQQGVIAIVLRLIPKKIKTLGELNLPPIIETFTRKQQGFFLVVGPVGHGKSTTLAAMVEMINESRAEHILTIEDPVEYVYEPKKSVIDQREIRIDTNGFHTALTSMFREDIDVVLIGEMRDVNTISTAVTAAETGHLVFSTLHTNNASQTINRIIDSFPSGQQDQIRMQLAGSLAGIFSQRLIPRVSGGLIPAYELLINNSAVANLIREKRVHEINSVVETSSGEGMIDMNRCLAELVRAGEITPESAFANTLDAKILERML